MNREQEAIALVETLVENSGKTNTRDIESYIRENEFKEIVGFMLEHDSWADVVESKIVAADIRRAKGCEYVAVARVLNEVIDEILFSYFCNDLIDLVHEIDVLVEAKAEAKNNEWSQDESEPTLDQINADDNAYFEGQRAL